jgi:hypothetical protein
MGEKKRTNKKVKVNGRPHTVYVGPRGGEYVKVNGKYKAMKGGNYGVQLVTCDKNCIMSDCWDKIVETTTTGNKTINIDGKPVYYFEEDKVPACRAYCSKNNEASTFDHKVCVDVVKNFRLEQTPPSVPLANLQNTENAKKKQEQAEKNAALLAEIQKMSGKGRRDKGKTKGGSK